MEHLFRSYLELLQSILSNLSQLTKLVHRKIEVAQMDDLAIRLADFPQPEAPGRDGVLLSAPYWDSRWKEPERGRIPACGMRPAPFPVFLLMTLQ